MACESPAPKKMKENISAPTVSPAPAATEGGSGKTRKQKYMAQYMPEYYEKNRETIKKNALDHYHMKKNRQKVQYFCRNCNKNLRGKLSARQHRLVLNHAVEKRIVEDQSAIVPASQGPAILQQQQQPTQTML